jgi:hypothetical protein
MAAVNLQKVRELLIHVQRVRDAKPGSKVVLRVAMSGTEEVDAATWLASVEAKFGEVLTAAGDFKLNEVI